MGHRRRARGASARRSGHKLALAVTVPGADVRGVLQRQRTATVRALQQHTRRRRALGREPTAAALVLDSLVFAAEAEVRWLDSCEARLLRRPGSPPSSDGDRT